MTKEELKDVDTSQLVEEVHVRIDALLELLEEKGLITEKEYVEKLNTILNKEEESQ